MDWLKKKITIRRSGMGATFYNNMMQMFCTIVTMLTGVTTSYQHFSSEEGAPIYSIAYYLNAENEPHTEPGNHVLLSHHADKRSGRVSDMPGTASKGSLLDLVELDKMLTHPAYLYACFAALEFQYPENYTGYRYVNLRALPGTDQKVYSDYAYVHYKTNAVFRDPIIYKLFNVTQKQVIDKLTEQTYIPGQ